MKNVYIETYGCQMNANDSGIVAKVLTDKGFILVGEANDADVVLLNTCSIRDNAEQRVKNRIAELNFLKRKKKNLLVGVLGCMAERLKDDLLTNFDVDIVVGPDSYRRIADALNDVSLSQEHNLLTALNAWETYNDINPLQMDTNGVTAFVSIMRGCENFCSYCVVPYTRGRERSRDCDSIVAECRELFANGYREITLLGQNVNSYLYQDGQTKTDFADLMVKVAQISPLLRLRFATSHPKDISDKLIKTIASYNNICKMVHLPLQSGSNDVLRRMNRKYTREDYLEKIKRIRQTIKDCSISTDIIVGFCGETQQDFEDTLGVMEAVGYDYAFMFNYSERPNTLAAKKYEDDITLQEKNRRLTQVINLQRELSMASNRRDIGKVYEVLVEGESKRSADKFFGRNSQNKVVVFDRGDISKGDYVNVRITDCTSATLIGKCDVG
ncbi:MAG: tRNA (N6-isopentenyl adenosine(37)-C2)-methylthiotransferase MiaB [Bacteroidales bacterium]|jgi:tRNA-2-methylthio-N6-dimethylallyladenosine synthase|nr:tRNA (N6-isopentenyl adenosine(37)-C2)-methylthiotransferase MiaB [Bacteroidales bacterium]